MMKKTGVLIVDDQKLVRQILEITVKESDTYTIAGETDNADLAELFCEKENVDLILMDVYTDYGADGIDAAGRIKKAHPEIKIIVMTSFPEASWIERARKAGVDSFWYKETEGVTLLDLMNRTMAGESVYPDKTPEIMLGNVASSTLSDMELAVLRELVDGKNNPEIAKALYVSVPYARDLVAQLLRKTGFSNRTKLAVAASSSGLALKTETKTPYT